MKRTLMERLIEWKGSPRRKPLVMRGMRQVGKTWLLKEFGRLHYEDLAYFNFEHNEALAERFRRDLDPERLILELGVINGRAIQPGTTLVFFDEIQFCGEALTALKYFQETMPEYHIVCAGSFLGIALAQPTSYPVGKVDLMTLRPMSFQEFLLANGEDMLVDYIADETTRPEPLADVFAGRLLDHLKTYYITGGMPEAVSVWLETRDVGKLESVQQAILDFFELDFGKHAPAPDIPKLGIIWNSIPRQLAKENKKFVYGLVKPGARARGFEDAMKWLENAGMVHKAYRVGKPSMPLKAYADSAHFKLYVSDVGLLRRMAGLSAKAILENESTYQEFKGGMAENYCLQELVAALGEVPFYWTSGNVAEVDFVVQVADMIVPIEVKSASNPRAKSLAVYTARHQPTVAVKASLSNLSYVNGLLNCPLYLLWRLPDIVKRIHRSS